MSDLYVYISSLPNDSQPIVLEFTPTNSPIRVGNGADCDIDLARYFPAYLSQHISRNHCLLLYHKGAWTITDERSRNKTYLYSKGKTTEEYLRNRSYPYPKSNAAKTVLDHKRLYGLATGAIENIIQFGIAPEGQLNVQIQIEIPTPPHETEGIIGTNHALFEALERYEDVSLVGIAGTGKSYLLHQLTEKVRDYPTYRNMVITYIDGYKVGQNVPLLVAWVRLVISKMEQEAGLPYNTLPRPLDQDYTHLSHCLQQGVEAVWRNTRMHLLFLFEHFDWLQLQGMPTSLFMLLRDLKDVRPQPQYLFALHNEFPTEPRQLEELRRIMPLMRTIWVEPLNPQEFNGIINDVGVSSEKVAKVRAWGGEQGGLTRLVAKHIGAARGTTDSQQIRYLLEQKDIFVLCERIWESLGAMEQKALMSALQQHPVMDEPIQSLLERKYLLAPRESVQEQIKILNPLFQTFLQRYLSQQPIQPSSETELPLIKNQPMDVSKFLPWEVNVIRYLVQHEERVVAYNEIANVLWEDGDTRTTSDVNNRIARLRNTLESIVPGARSHIQTVSGQGYRWFR